MTLSVELLHVGLLVSARAGALLFFFPLFAGKAIPKPVRLAVALSLAWMAAPFVAAAPPSLHLGGFVLSFATEILIGLFMGMAVRMVFFTLELAGQVISTELGLMMSRALDPVNNTNSTIVARILFYLGILVLLTTGIHHEFLLAFVRSFELIPAGAGMPLTAGNIETLVRDSGRVFTLGLQMAAPFIAVNFVVTLTFAVMGKAVPKMNVLMVSFAVRIWLGAFMLLLTLGLLTRYILVRASEAPENMLLYLGN